MDLDGEPILLTMQGRFLAVYSDDCGDDTCMDVYKEQYTWKDDEYDKHGYGNEIF